LLPAISRRDASHSTNINVTEFAARVTFARLSAGNSTRARRRCLCAAKSSAAEKNHSRCKYRDAAEWLACATRGHDREIATI